MRRQTEPVKFPTFADNSVEYQAPADPVAITETIGNVECCFFRVVSPRGERIFQHGKEDRYDNRANLSFLARAYKLPHQQYDHVVLMYNGLDETVFSIPDDLFSFYDQVGAKLAESGMLAILLPTPYHMNRALAYRSVDDGLYLKERILEKGLSFIPMHRPSAALTYKPEMIYANHFQGSRETFELCRLFRAEQVADFFPALESLQIVDESTSDDLRSWVAPEPSISLLGYSLGGLRAMTEFLFDRRLAKRSGRPPLFSGCVPICSGGSLADLAPPFWIDQTSWKRMIDNLVIGNPDEPLIAARKQFPDEKDFAQDYFQTLKDIFLGNAQSMRALGRDAAKTGRAMMFVLGGADTLVPPNSIQRINPEGGVNIVQVSGLGHMFQFDFAWNTTKNMICDVISQFLENAPALETLPDPEKLIQQLAYLDIRLKLIPYRSRIDVEAIRSVTNSLRQEALDEDFLKIVFGDAYNYGDQVGIDLVPSEAAEALRSFVVRMLRDFSLNLSRRLVNPTLFWPEWEKLFLDGILHRDSGLRQLVRDLVPSEVEQDLDDLMIENDFLTETRLRQLARFQERRLKPLRDTLFASFCSYCAGRSTKELTSNFS